jgi:hypothetical protein
MRLWQQSPRLMTTTSETRVGVPRSICSHELFCETSEWHMDRGALAHPVMLVLLFCSASMHRSAGKQPLLYVPDIVASTGMMYCEPQPYTCTSPVSILQRWWRERRLRAFVRVCMGAACTRCLESDGDGQHVQKQELNGRVHCTRAHSSPVVNGSPVRCECGVIAVNGCVWGGGGINVPRLMMLPATGCGRKIRTYRAAVDAGIVGADVVCPYETDTSAATVTATRRADVQQDMAAMGTRSDFNLARKTQRLLMVVASMGRVSTAADPISMLSTVWILRNDIFPALLQPPRPCALSKWEGTVLCKQTQGTRVGVHVGCGEARRVVGRACLWQAGMRAKDVAHHTHIYYMKGITDHDSMSQPALRRPRARARVSVDTCPHAQQPLLARTHAREKRRGVSHAVRSTHPHTVHTTNNWWERTCVAHKQQPQWPH